MPIRLGDTAVADFKWGTADITRVYLGTTEVYRRAVAPVDTAGVATFEVSGRNVRSDLTDADGIVSVQSVVMTLPNGSTRNVNAAERRNAPGTWRASTRSTASGSYRFDWTYTDRLGSGKTATVTGTR